MTIELDDDTLQRLYDGDLSPLEERSVRARVEQDPAAQERLSRLERLSGMFVLAAEDMADGLDSDALFATIHAETERQQKPGFVGRLEVFTGEWLAHKRGAVISLGAAAAIAAAALFAVATPSQRSDVQARTVPRPREEQRVRIAEAVPAAGAASHGSQIENVDFGRNTGTVFELENEGVTTAVVWIADEEEDLP